MRRWRTACLDYRPAMGTMNAIGHTFLPALSPHGGARVADCLLSCQEGSAVRSGFKVQGSMLVVGCWLLKPAPLLGGVWGGLVTPSLPPARTAGANSFRLPGFVRVRCLWCNGRIAKPNE